MSVLHLRVFVSSPDDLSAERACAKEVIERLSGQEVEGWRVLLEPMLWETDSPPVVGQKAQQAIDYYFGKASETDIYLGMLWSTLGSTVVLNNRRYSSGTLYEFEDAYARSRSVHRPKMLMYRCDRASDAPAGKVEQVRRFFDSFKGEFPAYEGSPARFVETEQFRERLQRDLLRVLKRIVQERQAEQEAAKQPADGRSVPELGRAVLLKELGAFLRNYDDIFGEGREHEDAFPVNFIRLDTVCDAENAPQPQVAPNNSLVELYESAGRRLLFVGEAGSGKTFAMLRLMQQLLERAKHAPTLPLPVYLNLSSWTPLFSGGRGTSGWFDASGSDGGIASWVVDELVRRYSLPRRAATHLVANRQLIFCLDGLDEIGHRTDEAGETPIDGTTRALWQKTCISSINRLLKDESVEMILCGRMSLLETLGATLDVPCRLQIEPLDPAMCVSYLERWANLDGLRAALQTSPALAQRLQNPLFLRMMSVAYRDMRAEPIIAAASKSEFEWQTHLIDNYIRHCLSMIPDSGRWYFSSQAPRYLSWFAAHAEADFLLEDLQPSMLFPPAKAENASSEGGDATEKLESAPGEVEGNENDALVNRSYRAYRFRSTLALATALALCAALPLGVAIGVEWSGTAGVLKSAGQGAFLAACAFGVTMLFATPAFASGRWWVFGGLLGVAFAIVRGLTVGLSSPEAALGGTFGEGLAAAAGTCPVSTVVFLLLGYQMFSALEEHRNRYRSKAGIRWYEIQPLESLDWRWIDSRNRWRGGWLGLVIGPASGAFLWLLFDPARGLAFGTLITVFVCMFSGFLGTGIRVSLEPNQGIIRSCRHALLTGTLFTAAGVFACAVSYGAVHGMQAGAVNAILGLTASLVVLALGGIPVVRHVCLGHVLSAQGRTPTWWSWPPWAPTVRFLEDMVRYKLLRRTAGGYSFRHGMIRDYFVRLWHERFADQPRN
jgi:hypothetical protein